MNLGFVVTIVIVAAIIGYLLIIGSRIVLATRKKTEESVPTAEPVLVEAKRSGEHTVLKVTIDNALKWHLELDGVRLENPGVINPEQRQRLISSIAQIRPWLDGNTAPPEYASTTPAPTPELPPLKSLQASTVVPHPAAPAPLKIDAMRGFRSLLNNEVKTPSDKKGTSIVAMIDEVLQAKLLGTPLMEKSVRLEEGPNGGVVVCVGSQQYTGIDSIPEPEIREVIKAAITAWEKK